MKGRVTVRKSGKILFQCDFDAQTTAEYSHQVKACVAKFFDEQPDARDFTIDVGTLPAQGPGRAASNRRDQARG